MGEVEGLDLGPIEERQMTTYRPALSFYPTSPSKDAVFNNVAKDIEALIAEVKRLREANKNLHDNLGSLFDQYNEVAHLNHLARVELRRLKG